LTERVKNERKINAVGLLSPFEGENKWNKNCYTFLKNNYFMLFFCLYQKDTKKKRDEEVFGQRRKKRVVWFYYQAQKIAATGPTLESTY
jgi:hypothetical protein